MSRSPGRGRRAKGALVPSKEVVGRRLSLKPGREPVDDATTPLAGPAQEFTPACAKSDRMTPRPSESTETVLAHVLFMDVIGSELLGLEQQSAIYRELTELVRQT